MLSILHTCDFHGRLSEERAGAIAALKQVRTGSLLLDCGDALRIGNLNPGWSGGEVLRRMNAAGYDAMAMGNRETHLWWPAVRRKLRGADFPIISSNLCRPRSPVLRSLVVSTEQGIKVGLLALTPQMVRAGTLAACFASVVFDDPIQSARETASSLASRADLVVCLSHLGTEFDRRLAAAVPEIDVVIGGHDHSPGMPEGEWHSSTLLVRSSPYGENLGEVIVGAKTEKSRARWEMSARLIPLPE